MARTPMMSKLLAWTRRVRPASEGPSRRDVLAALGAALAVPSLGSAGCTPKDARVAVIGAGLSGTHCAYRLWQAGANVVLYEASGRVGGRTFTGRALFADDQICELGGELIDTNHAHMWALAEELGITLDDRLGPPYDDLHAETIVIGGEEVSEATILEQFRLILPALQADFDAAETDDDAFTALNHETLASWLDRNLPVGTGDALRGLLIAAYRGEYGLEMEEQSALNLIYLVGLDDEAFRIFGDSDERYHAHEGSDAFASRMAAALPAGTVEFGHKLIKAEGRRSFTLTFETTGGEVVVEADKIVFALPYSVLRGIDLDGLRLSAFKRQIIGELGMGMNAKIMLGFERPVWREDHGAAGAITSDLPFQQAWDSSLGQAGSSAILTNFLGGNQAIAAGEGEPEEWAATVVLPDLETIFPGVEEAFSGPVERMHWPSNPLSQGSYVCYRPGQWDFWSFEGEREGDVHFAGDQGSLDWGGWMEGAADAGARAALEVIDDLGLEIPGPFAALAALHQAMPRPGLGRRTPLRTLRERRVWLRAFRERSRG